MSAVKQAREQMPLLRSLRTLAGIALRDMPLYAKALGRQGDSYLAVRNRGESLEPAAEGPGYQCQWSWTSDLHAPRHVPILGRALLARALAHHPVDFADVPRAGSQTPLATFLIGHRGEARLPLLLATLRTLAAQDVPVECIVIEQDVEPRLAGRLPSWVSHLHCPPPAADMPFCRSWAFNVGARHARSDVLVLHDNDMLVATSYARNILGHVDQGFEAANIKRFVFYLRERHTRGVLAGTAALDGNAPEAIVQNLEAGGSLAITRDAYARIGGMDESFVGWGGEDNEFWERVRTLRLWPFGYMPLVHLWHAPQAGKQDTTNPTLHLQRQLSAIPAARRIEQLRARHQGSGSGPVGWAGANFMQSGRQAPARTTPKETA